MGRKGAVGVPSELNSIYPGRGDRLNAQKLDIEAVKVLSRDLTNLIRGSSIHVLYETWELDISYRHEIFLRIASTPA